MTSVEDLQRTLDALGVILSDKDAPDEVWEKFHKLRELFSAFLKDNENLQNDLAFKIRQCEQLQGTIERLNETIETQAKHDDELRRDNVIVPRKQLEEIDATQWLIEYEAEIQNNFERPIIQLSRAQILGYFIDKELLEAKK